jgi:hypothetical protein
MASIIDRFNLADAKSASTPIEPGLDITPNDIPDMDDPDLTETKGKPILQIVGALNYAQHTRIDIMLALHIISRYMAKPFHKLWLALYYLCRFVKTYPEYERKYKRSINALIAYKGKARLVLTMFVDASYAPIWSAHARSVTCFLMYLGSCLIHCEVRTQSVVAQSSTEAEIIALSAALKKAHFVMDFLAELGFDTHLVIYEDNNGTIANATGMQMNDAVKHIRTKYWFIREATEPENVDVRKVHTYWQLADFHTKIHNVITWRRLLDAIHNFDPSVDYSKLTPDDTVP